MALTDIDGGRLADSAFYAGKNLIINGAMQAAQRGTSATNSGYGSVDRWRPGFNNVGITHSQQTLSSGDPYDEGFRYFYRQANTSVSSGASTYIEVFTKLEAQDIAGSGWNYNSTSSYITISFWARSSLAGTYYSMLRSEDTNVKFYSKAFTLSANTWKKVTYTVPGHSDLRFDNDNGEGLRVHIIPYYGTDYTDNSVSTDTWFTISGSNYMPDYLQNWANTASATFDITGVQLEVGASASAFEHRSYGDELGRCQRYYYKTQPGQYRSFAIGYNRNTTLTHAFTTFPVPMRTAPSAIETSGTAGDYSINYLASNTTCSAVPTHDYASTVGADFNFTVSSGLTAGQGAKVIAQAADGYLAWSAEL